MFDNFVDSLPAFQLMSSVGEKRQVRLPLLVLLRWKRISYIRRQVVGGTIRNDNQL